MPAKIRKAGWIRTQGNSAPLGSNITVGRFWTLPIRPRGFLWIVVSRDNITTEIGNKTSVCQCIYKKPIPVLWNCAHLHFILHYMYMTKIKGQKCVHLVCLYHVITINNNKWNTVNYTKMHRRSSLYCLSLIHRPWWLSTVDWMNASALSFRLSCFTLATLSSSSNSSSFPQSGNLAVLNQTTEEYRN